MSVETTAGAPAPNGLVRDIRSGFLVFLIALPLCLGIAMASGFPPVAGVLTAIVGGVLVTHLGSARLTIKGPAAGLIAIVLAAVQDLGQGDVALGYRRALAVGVIAAGIQIGFALVRAASIGVAISPSVVHGMLAAIGVIIVSKQAHVVLGVAPHAKEPLELLAEVPHSIAGMNPEIAVIGIVSLLILFGMPMLEARWARVVPAPMVVLAVAVPLGFLFDLDHVHTYSFASSAWSVGPDYLVQLPGTILDAVAFPDFSVAFTPASLKYVAMYALVGTIESTLSVLAVDSMDPEKRASDLDRDLLALGVGNLISASIGGLPMISEIVRSKANVTAGAGSHWSNFFHGAFLLAFVALAPGLLHRIPLAALAAMLLYTGTRLAHPHELAHARALGPDQLLLFTVTLVVTLATDLLVGVAVGLALKIVLHFARGASPRALFRPRIETANSGDEIRLRVHGAAAFPSLLSIRKQLSHLAPEVRRVTIDLSDAVLVDHTFMSRLRAMAEEWKGAELVLFGLEDFVASSEHPHAARRRRSPS
jgi:MFS superfamily sulfate permease-like transporter